jgi:nucleotide-binding universal stress UspA family protein
MQVSRQEDVMNVELTRILVPVDFSAESDRAVGYAVALAKKTAGAVELLHVVEDPIASGAWGAEAYVSYVPDLLDELVADATVRLGSVKAGCDESVAIGTRVVTGSPARTIVAIAEAERCDLIVMGTHGRSGLSHVLLGSVAERVLRTAPCPVLTLRAEKTPAETKAAATVEAVAS